MPIIDPGSEPKIVAGMTRQRIIDLANTRTDKVAEKKRLDLDALFLEVLQEFCAEHRWFWRKRSVAFYTAGGTAEYNLADEAKDAIDCEEIISVKYFRTKDDWSPVNPIFDTDTQDASLEDDAQGEPNAYFIKTGTSTVVRMCPIPKQAYRLRITFWAMPNVTSDQQRDNIPLVPGFHHHIIVKGLIAKITKDPVDIAIYQQAVDRASEVREFARGRVREFTSGENAVRSC